MGAGSLRIAALAFGVLAGLVASLILALGGLDVSAGQIAAGDRQAALVRFGLFLIGNLGVFAAALALTAPLAGTILAVLAALAWVIASLLLGHGPDFVLITPPALLLLCAGFGVLAHVQAPRPQSAALFPLDLDEAETDSSDSDAEREAALSAAPDALAFDVEPDIVRPRSRPVDIEAEFTTLSSSGPAPADGDWKPGRKRPVPPRATPAFRSPDDEDDDQEEGAVSRLARGAGSLLTFALYGTLAAAAVLVFWSLRSGDSSQPAVAVIDSASSSTPVATAPASSEPRLVPILPSSSAPPPASVALAPSSSLPPPAPPSSLPPPSASEPPIAVATARDPELVPPIAPPPPEMQIRIDPVTGIPSLDDTGFAAAAAATPDPAPVASSASASSSSSLEPVAPGQLTATAPVLPRTMSPAMAAARLRPAPALPAPDNTGL